jgi:hypothetical protein
VPFLIYLCRCHFGEIVLCAPYPIVLFHSVVPMKPRTRLPAHRGPPRQPREENHALLLRIWIQTHHHTRPCALNSSVSFRALMPRVRALGLQCVISSWPLSSLRIAGCGARNWNVPSPDTSPLIHASRRARVPSDTPRMLLPRPLRHLHNFPASLPFPHDN